MASEAKIVAGPVLLYNRKNNYLLPFMLRLEGRKVSWVHSLSAKLLGGRWTVARLDYSLPVSNKWLTTGNKIEQNAIDIAFSSLKHIWLGHEALYMLSSEFTKWSFIFIVIIT